MKWKLLAVLGLILILSGCNYSPPVDTKDSIEESTESVVVSLKSATDLSVIDVMDYMTSAYSDYNTFVFVDDTIHIMNCIDSVNCTTADLVREISSITNSSYELVSVSKFEESTKLLSRRIDYISIEDSNDSLHWNQNTNDIIAIFQQGCDDLKRIYDQYEIVIRESVPGVTDYIGKKEAIITELMGKVEPKASAGFATLCTNDKKQIFIFPDSFFDCKFSKDNLTVQIWETTNPAEVSPYQRDIVDGAVDSFIDSTFLMPGYKELFSDVLPEEILNKYDDKQINVRDFKTLVNWKATYDIADGITADDYETRTKFVESAFDYAIDNIHSSAYDYRSEITYDYGQPPAVIILSQEPYYSLFMREVRQIFEDIKQQIENTLSESIVGTLPDIEVSSTIENYIQDVLYGDPNSDGEEYMYNVFVYYEEFYGPQTEEQMRNVLEDFKNRLGEYVYDEFAESYDNLILEVAIQKAHTEMESWWDIYLNKNKE